MSALTTTDTEGTVTSEEVTEGRFEVWLSYDDEKVQRLARSDKLHVAFRHAYAYVPVYPNSTVIIERDGRRLYRMDKNLVQVEDVMWAGGWHPFLLAFLSLRDRGLEQDRGGGPVGLKWMPGKNRSERFATETVVDEVLRIYRTRYIDVALLRALKQGVTGRAPAGRHRERASVLAATAAVPPR